MTEDKFDVALRLYDEWSERREALSAAEGEGEYPDPDAWADSDDEGVSIAHDLASLLREALARSVLR